MSGSLRDLEQLFVDWQAAVSDFQTRPDTTSFRLFLRNHAPLILLTVLFSIVSPLPWIFGSRFSFTTRIIMPLGIPMAVVLITTIFDRILHYERVPRIDEEPMPSNVALFCALPACSAALFYLIHPMVGILASGVSAIYSLLLALRSGRIAYGLSAEQTLIRGLGAFLFFMIPVIAILIVFNVLTSLRILSKLV